MRLWHNDLISILPRQQLVGQWRELNSIFRLHNKHTLINFVYNYPKEHLINYAMNVISEMGNRGYRYNVDNLRTYIGNESYKHIENPFPEKMTNRYLLQCYFNLQEKYDCGSISDDDWKKN